MLYDADVTWQKTPQAGNPGAGFVESRLRPNVSAPRSVRELTQEASHTPRVRRQAGSVTIWGVGLTLIIALFAGLVIDTWRVFAERQDLAGMADAAVIAGATAIDIEHLNQTGEVVLAPAEAEDRAAQYLAAQDGWSADITPTIDAQLDGVAVVLEKDVEFTLIGALLPGEEPFRVTVTAVASPNTVSP